MRLGYLACTPEFMQGHGLAFIPRAWKLVGSDRADRTAPMWLIFENDEDGPNVEITILIQEGPMSIVSTVVIKGPR